MAFIRNTDRLIEGSSKLFFSNVRAKAAVQSDLDLLSSDISAEESARQSEDSGIKLRLDVIEGGAGVSGSIAKAQADAQAYADQKVAALVNSAPSVLDTLKELSDAIGGDASFASTIAGQIGAVDDKVDQEILDRQAAISALESSLNSDVSALESAIEAEESRAMLAEGGLNTRLQVLEADPVTKSYVDGEISSVEGQVSSEQSRAEAAEGLLDGRLDVLEQDPTTKTYVDGEVSSLQSQITQEISDRQGAVSAEESRAMAAEGLLDGRLDVLEQDPTTKSYVDGIQSALDGRLDLLEADPVSKTYVDGEVSDLQGQITQEISDRQSAISSVEGMVEAEETRAMAAEGLLDGRLDILEQDPTTKTYVDSEVASEESRAMSAESALSGRLDALELDPVSKTYVDGEVSDLQGQVTTEKGRIDAILSASEADKDSFAEIVSLINSVDTTNDSAFAGYVLSNDAALAQEVSDRQAGDSALDARLDIIEGLDSVEGSVAKAEKDAKDYADAAVLVEKNRAEAAEGLLDGRLDVLESDPTTKAYVDGEISSVESRLDVIEGIGEGSVAKAEQDAKDYADSLNSAMDARVDVLEADPTTKSYVDSEVAALEAENLTMLKLDGSRSMSGQMKAVVGTVTNPGYAFVGNTGTGMYSASGALRMSVSGSERFVLSPISVQVVDVPFQVNAGFRMTRAAVVGNATISATGSTIYGVTSLSAPRVLTLPTTVTAGHVFYIKDETGLADNTNYIRIQAPSGRTIDGESYYDIKVPYEGIKVYSNGTNWFII